MAAMNQVLSTRTVLTAAPFTVLFAVCVIGALMADPDRRGLVALADASNVGEMDVLTDRIGGIDGVERTTTSIILSTKFER